MQTASTALGKLIGLIGFDGFEMHDVLSQGKAIWDVMGARLPGLSGLGVSSFSGMLGLDSNPESAPWGRGSGSDLGNCINSMEFYDNVL